MPILGPSNEMFGRPCLIIRKANKMTESVENRFLGYNRCNYVPKIKYIALEFKGFKPDIS